MNTQQLVDHWNWLAVQSDAYLAVKRAECALLGHVPSGEVFLTTNPTHVCYECLMRYTKGDFGYVEYR